MKFSNSKYIIEVDFKYKASKDDYTVRHNRENNRVELDMNGWFKHYEDFEGQYLRKQFRGMVVHELTHWFDWNCYDAFTLIQGAKADIAEVLAQFNNLFHDDIEQFANIIIDSSIVKRYLEAK